MGLRDTVDEFLGRPTDTFSPMQAQKAGDLGLFGFLPEKNFSIGGTANSLITGFLSGFTGFEIGDAPENSVEAIARSIGGVAGFVGYVPGAGVGGKLAATSIGKAFGLGRTGAAVGRFIQAAGSKSLPLQFADQVINRTANLAKNSAFVSSLKFLENPRTRDIIHEGARLGLASGFAAPWTEGIDEVLIQTGLGVADGAGFAGLNSAIRKGFNRYLGGTPREQAFGEASLRGLSNVVWTAAVNNMQSDFFNAPLEVQAFEYLLAFGMGVRDMPYETRKASEFLSRKNRVDILNIENTPGFASLDDAVKSEVLFQRESLLAATINASGDTEGAGTAARSITGLYKNLYQERYDQLISEGLSENEAFIQAKDYATRETGVFAHNRQQEIYQRDLGAQVVDELSRGRSGAVPDIYVGDNPDAAGRAVYYDKESDRITIDDRILQKEFKKQTEEENPARFRDRLILEEYLGKTSASDVDVPRLVDEKISSFRYDKPETPVEAPGEPLAGTQVSTKPLDITKISDGDLVVRLYRGEGNDQNQNGLWFTTDLKKAKQFSAGKRVLYVDMKASDILANAAIGHSSNKDVVFGDLPDNVKEWDPSIEAPDVPQNGRKTKVEVYEGSNVQGGPRRLKRLKKADVEELVRDIGARTETERSAISTNNILNARDQMNQAREDHEITSLIATPATNFASELRNIDPSLNNFDAKNIVFRAFAKKNTTWDEALGDIWDTIRARGIKDFSIDEGTDASRALRRAWKLYKSGQGVRQAHYSRGVFGMYGENGLGRVDGSGKPITKSKAPTHLDNTLSGKVASTFVVENTESQAGSRIKVEPIFEDRDFDPGAYLQESFVRGTPFFAGTKDKGRNHHTEGFLFDKADAPRLFKEKMAAIARVEADLGKKDLTVQDAVDKLKGDTQAIGLSEEAFEALMLNNIRILEEMNGGITFEEMIRANATGEGQFVMSPNGLNKRMQLTDDGSPTADPAQYPVDMQEIGGARALVVGAKDFTGEGVEPIMMRFYGDPKKMSEEDRKRIVKGSDGKPLRDKKGRVVFEKEVDHHMDGVVFESQDVFDARIRDIGGDPDAGVIKGSTVFSTETEGMLLGKMAIFRAPDALQKEMDRLGADGNRIHQIYLDTATKQRGMRKQYALHVKKDGTMQIENPATNLHRAIAPENVKSFIVPFSGQRMNLSVGENVRKAKSDQHAPSQVHTTLEDPEAIRYWIDNYIRPSVEGDKRMNDAIGRYKVTLDKDILENLDWDSVSLDQIMRIYTGYRQEVVVDDGLFSSLVSHIMRKEKEDPSEFDGADEFNHEDIEAFSSLQEFASTAQRLLSLWDLTPGVVGHEHIRPYVDSAVRNYLMKRVTRPKLKYSGKVIAAPADPFLRRTLDIKPGYVYLDEAWKTKRIKWIDGKEITLEKAFDKYNKAKANDPKKKEMQKALSFATIRVPSDSLSGTRMLEFGGFTGRRGAGGTVHNEEMVNLGGMDLDIDSFFIFQNPGDPIAKHFNDYRNQWKDENGVIIDSKNPDNDRDYVVSLEEHERHPIATADPRLLLSSSMGAYRGNQLLGIAAVAGRRGSTWFARAISGDEDALNVAITKSVRKRVAKEIGFLPEEVQVTLIPADDKRAFDLARREAMNRAADAGDFPGFIQDKMTLGNYIGKELVKGVRITWTDQQGRTRSKTLTDDQSRGFFTPSKSNLWRKLQSSDYYAKGRNYGGSFTLDRAWNILSRSIPGLGEAPKGFDPDIEYRPDEVGSKLAEIVRRRSGQKIDGAVIEKILSDSPDRETSTYSLSETMKGLKMMADGLDVENTYYQALRMLASTPFEDRSRDISYVNEKGWRKLANTFNRIFKENTPEAQLVRRLVGRDGLRVQEQGEIEPWMLKQDLSDLVTTRIVYDAALDAAKKGVDLGRLDGIAKEVEKYKDLHKKATECA